jgi:hypothetical protein
MFHVPKVVATAEEADAEVQRLSFSAERAGRGNVTAYA